MAIGREDGVVRGRRQNAEPLFTGAQRLLGSLPLGDIARQHEVRPPTFVTKLVRRDLDLDGGAVVLAVPPRPPSGVAGADAGHRLAQCRQVLWRPDVGDGHGEELGPGVAVGTHRGLVHFEEPQRVQVEDPRGERSAFEQQPIALFGLPQPGFCPRAPGHLAPDQHARDAGERERHEGAGPRRQARQASLALQGGRALREQPFLLVLHLAHQSSHLLHQLFSPAADHGPAGGGGAPGTARVDGPLEPLEVGRDERVQRIEPALLRGIVRRQGPQPRQAAVQGRPHELVGGQVARVARDHVAAHAGLGFHEIGEAGLELGPHLQGVGHPVRTADGRIRAAQRGGAHGHDDRDGDAKPELDPALERQARPHHARFRRSVVPSSTSRTVRARASGVKGFCTNTNPGSSTPWRVIASSV